MVTSDLNAHKDHSGMKARQAVMSLQALVVAFWVISEELTNGLSPCHVLELTLGHWMSSVLACYTSHSWTLLIPTVVTCIVYNKWLHCLWCHWHRAHKMAALTVLFLRLLNVDFNKEDETSSEKLQRLFYIYIYIFIIIIIVVIFIRSNRDRWCCFDFALM